MATDVKNSQPGHLAKVTVLESAARTATPTKVDYSNQTASGIIVVVDVTASAATPSVVVTIQGKDELSGVYWTLLASAAITGAGTTVLQVYPGMLAAANAKADFILPKVWAVDCVHGDTDSISYSVAAILVP